MVTIYQLRQKSTNFTMNLQSKNFVIRVFKKSLATAISFPRL